MSKLRVCEDSTKRQLKDLLEAYSGATLELRVPKIGSPMACALATGPEQTALDHYILTHPAPSP